MSGIIPLNERSLTFKAYGKRCTLEFDEEHLTCSFQDWPELQINKIPLWRVMPDLIVDRSIPVSSRKYGRIARYAFVASVVSYFSDFRVRVPLLAPTLLLWAAYAFYQ